MCSMFACSSDSTEDQDVNLASMPPAMLQEHLRTRVDLRPLSREPIPLPIGGHIIDQAAAVRLGKAFFWDIQAGSDGQVACATCHATGGSDARRLNTLNPGPTRTNMRLEAYPAEDRSKLADPAQLVPPYLYLLGPASRGVTGARFDCQ